MRVVVRGFQEQGRDCDESWAGVANAASVRVLLAPMSLFALKTRQVDIATAFLNAYLYPKEEVYIRPPSPI